MINSLNEFLFLNKVSLTGSIEKNINALKKIFDGLDSAQMDSVVGEKYFYGSSDTPEGPATAGPNVYLVGKNQIIFMYYSHYPKDRVKIEELFKKILSTFKFIE